MKQDINALITEFINNLRSQDINLFPYLYNEHNKSEINKVYYSGPYWTDDEIVNMIRAILTGKWISSGENVRKFEVKFSKMFNVKHSLMLNSGSSANLVMMAALKKRFGWKDDDEIILSVVGFPTSLAPIIQNRLKPIFLDIENDTLNFDLSNIEDYITDRTRAILISPVLGNSPDMDRLISIAEKFNIQLVLDNCDSLGSKWNDKYLNEYAVASSCSFYPAHHITTGEGGMVSSNDEELITIARSIAWWGRDCYCVGAANLLACGTCGNRFDKWLPGYDGIVDHKYVFTNVGYNLKPLDLQGAIGLAQLDKFEEIHSKRRINKEIIENIFKEQFSFVKIPGELKKSQTSWFGVPIICESREDKSQLVSHLEGKGIQTRNYFAGNILLHPAYADLDDYSKYPNANKVLDTVFFLGCAPNYTNETFEYIKKVIGEHNHVKSSGVL